MNTNHAQEITSTRSIGFGGSDAAMILRIGKGGFDAITKSDRERIKVVKGLADYVPTPSTPAMKAGHDFEDYIAGISSLLFGDGVEREKFLTREGFQHFRVFAHADYAIPTADGLKIFELKYSKKATEEVLTTYHAQCQWYYLLGATEVYLVHGLNDGEGFDMTKVTTILVERDESVIDYLAEGLRMLDDGWDSVPLDDETDVPFAVESKVTELSDLLRREEELTARIKELRAEVEGMLSEEKATSLECGGLAFRWTPPTQSVKFDEKSFRQDNPDIDFAQWERQVEKKGFWTVRKSKEQ